MTTKIAVQLVEALSGFRSSVRIKSKGSSPFDWDWPLFSPSPSYLETGRSGPFPLSEIECIDIEVEETKHRGRLVSPIVVSHAAEIEALLAKLNLPHERIDGYFRVMNRAAK